MMDSFCLLLVFALSCVTCLLAFLLYCAKHEKKYLEDRLCIVNRELADCNERREADSLSKLAKDLVFPGMVVNED